MRKSQFDTKLIMLLALLLRDAELLDNTTWRRFSESFFKNYKKQIQNSWGYKQSDFEMEKVTVEKIYSTLFLNCIGYMMREGIIPDCTFEKMAGHIDKMFDTGYPHDTVLGKLKEQNTEYWQIEEVINSEKKRIKSKNKSEIK